MSSVRVLAAGLAVGLSVGLTGCAVDQDGPSEVLSAMQARQQAEQAAAVQASSPASASGTAAAKCSPVPEASFPPLASLPGPGKAPAGSLLAEIQARKTLVVGVSGDTRLLGARNSLEGGGLEGFDIELAKAVGRAIFGADGHVQFKVITAGERFPLVNQGVKNGGVDLVARAVSMTCDRWQATDASKGSLFSAGYFKSEQRLLVRSDLGLTAITALKPGANRVCAPKGSTSLANLAKYKNVEPVEAEIHSDCLALWQEGRVDAVTGDDAILAGFADQDPRARVVGGSLDSTFYGFAIGKGHADFVQYVNAVMATSEFRSTWNTAYTAFLANALGGQAQTLPAPNYSRPLPR